MIKHGFCSFLLQFLVLFMIFKVESPKGGLFTWIQRLIQAFARTDTCQPNTDPTTGYRGPNWIHYVSVILIRTNTITKMNTNIWNLRIFFWQLNELYNNDIDYWTKLINIFSLLECLLTYWGNSWVWFFMWSFPSIVSAIF